MIKFILSNKMEINIELNQNDAPITSQNFLNLAKNGFYEGLCFHRVIPNFMIQGGGFSISKNNEYDAYELVAKKADAISGEFISNGYNNPIKHTKGTISMARTMDKNSASSQFFICVEDCFYLDGQYAAFGKVKDEQSLNNAIEISKVKTGKWLAHDDVPIEPILIEKVIID